MSLTSTHTPASSDPNPTLGYATDIEIIDRLLSIVGLSLVDVGCGHGALARQLVERGATVLGVEPDPVQAEINRKTDPLPGLTLTQATAEHLPVSAHSVDGILFMKSLHHVPADQMDRALEQAALALKPDRGFLYITEPDSRGPFSQLIQPFHDETRVRQLALEALDRTANRLFHHQEEYWYTTISRFESFEAFEQQMRAHTFNDYGDKTLDSPPIQARFAAGWDGESYRFENLMRLRLYRGIRSERLAG